MYKLFDALGKKFDGVIEGINTEETAVDFFDKPLLQPPGFSFKGYTQAWIDNLMALKKAFPKSIVMVYANFMPGGYMPSQNPSYLRAIYNFAWQNNIGVGGPDLLPYEKKQMTNSYPFIRDSYKKVVSGVAVQDGTFDYTNPATKAKVTAKEIYDFAENYLHLTYIFWGTENPFFKSQTVPLLQAIRLKCE